MKKSRAFIEAADESMYGYPCHNLSPVDMEGEIWKPLPEYEEYVMVSSLGRVKFLPRQIEFVPAGKRKATRYFTREMICKQLVTTTYNRSIKESRSRLSFTLNVKSASVKRRFLVARAVYMAFVSKEEVKDVSFTYMCHYDNDPFNNRVENLYCVTGKELHKYIYHSGRSLTSLKFEYNWSGMKKKKEEQRKTELQLNAWLNEASPYPCQNMSLKDMEGEIWKPLPGAGDYYLISNCGRIKIIPRLCKRTTFGRIVHFLSKEKIYSQGTELRYNSYLKKKILTLHFTGKQGKADTRYVPRLVYIAFAGKIPAGSMVVHKDSDPFNNRIENLYLTSDRKTIAKYRLNPITQYDREGNPIQTFESIQEASRILSVNCNSIASVIRGENVTAGGYLFRKGFCTEKIDVSTLGVHPRMKRASVARRIAKYDMEGNLIEIYPSLKDAFIQNQCCKTVLKKCLEGHKEKVQLQHIKQYDWKYYSGQ
jgi:hypothetical protein